MRIGIVCPYAWDAPGGVRSHVADLAQTLIARGHEVSVLAPIDEHEDVPDWIVDGGRPVSVPYNGSVAKLSFGVKATGRVRRWIRDGDFDVLHVHEPLAPSLSLLACWVGRGPIVATWHSSSERSRMLSAGFYIAQTAMEKVIARIAVSEDARRFLVGHVGGDAVVIPNGVRVSDFVTEERLPEFDPARPSMVFLGRMDEPRKGLHVLVGALPEIVAKVPNVQVVIVGPGDIDDQRESLDPSVRDNVVYLGRVSDADKARAFASADIYIAPHTGGESFGIVLAEAMAASTAVLASDLPAFRNVLADGEAGRLFPTGDCAALAQAAVDLLTDAPAREALVTAGRSRVMDFDWDHVVDDVIAVYDSVTVNGEHVTEDLRGQLVGRLMGRG
jgi:phosphatidyl-myo-inositol alpha-mannosyltransferase